MRESVKVLETMSSLMVYYVSTWKMNEEGQESKFITINGVRPSWAI